MQQRTRQAALADDRRMILKYMGGSNGRHREARRSVAVAGILVSTFLHTLLLVPLVLGYGQPRQHAQPNVQGTATMRPEEFSPDAMTAIFIEDDRAITGTAAADEPVVHFRLPKPTLRTVAMDEVAVSHLDPSQDDGRPPAAEANGDPPGQSMMFGRYMGQIAARVERVWVRPRSIPAGGAFACRAQITQDRRGNVLEVTLLKCTADSAWQVSLIRAIGSASPLPAPPDATVFSETMILEFDSDAYVAGGSDLGFEPALRSASQVAPSGEIETAYRRTISSYFGSEFRRGI
jgi:hypothetical protein